MASPVHSIKKKKLKKGKDEEEECGEDQVINAQNDDRRGERYTQAAMSSHAAPDQQRPMLRRSDVAAQEAKKERLSAKGIFM